MDEKQRKEIKEIVYEACREFMRGPIVMQMDEVAKNPAWSDEPRPVEIVESFDIKVNFTDLEPFKSLIATIIRERNYHKYAESSAIELVFSRERIMGAFETFLKDVDKNMKGDD